MKSSILRSGKLYEYQQQLQYNKHKQKITQISKKKRNNSFYQKQTKKSKSQTVIIQSPSNNRIPQNQHYVRQQNNRLVKRLFEINRRKRFQILNSQQQQNQVIKLTQLHKKYSQINRLKRQKEIQQENAKLVQKLLDSRRQQSERLRQQYFRNDNSEKDVLMSRLSRSQKSNKKRSQKKNNKKYHQKLGKSNITTIDKLQYLGQQKYLHLDKLNSQQKDLILFPQRKNKQINKQQQQQISKQNYKRRNHSTLILPQVNSQYQIKQQYQKITNRKEHSYHKNRHQRTNKEKTNINNNIMIKHSQILTMLEKYYKYKQNDNIHGYQQSNQGKLKKKSIENDNLQLKKQYEQQQKQKQEQYLKKEQNQQDIQQHSNNPEQQSSLLKNKKDNQPQQTQQPSLLQISSQLSYNANFKFQRFKQKRTKNNNKTKQIIIKSIISQQQNQQYLNQQFELDVDQPLQQQQQ